MTDLIERLRERARIRRSIPRGEPDRISDICEESASEIERLREENTRLLKKLAAAHRWYDEEYPAEEGHDQVCPWDHE